MVKGKLKCFCPLAHLSGSAEISEFSEGARHAARTERLLVAISAMSIGSATLTLGRLSHQVFGRILRANGWGEFSPVI
jgi:hypothetical protein